TENLYDASCNRTAHPGGTDKMTELYFQRHRRLRQNAAMRALVKETYLQKEDLIYPLFIIEGENVKNPVSSMPGVFQLSLDNTPGIELKGFLTFSPSIINKGYIRRKC